MYHHSFEFCTGVPLVIKGICLFSEWPSPSVRNSFSLTRRVICMYFLQALAVQVPRGSYNRGMRWSSIVHITLKNNREQAKIGVRRERSCEHLPGQCCNKRPSVQAPSPRRRPCRTKPQKIFPRKLWSKYNGSGRCIVSGMTTDTARGLTTYTVTLRRRPLSLPRHWSSLSVDLSWRSRRSTGKTFLARPSTW